MIQHSAVQYFQIGHSSVFCFAILSDRALLVTQRRINTPHPLYPPHTPTGQSDGQRWWKFWLENYHKIFTSLLLGSFSRSLQNGQKWHSIKMGNFCWTPATLWKGRTPYSADVTNRAENQRFKYKTTSGLGGGGRPRVDRSWSFFYFVPQDSHSQADSAGREPVMIIFMQMILRYFQLFACEPICQIFGWSGMTLRQK